MELDIRSPEFRTDPYPFYRRLRVEAPVCRIAPHGHWAIARHADVLSILRDPKRFPSCGAQDEPAAGASVLREARALIGSNPPEHTRLRALVGKAFTPVLARAMEPRIRSIAGGLLDDVADQDTLDFISALAAPLPLVVIAELLGVDPARRNDFKRWSDTLITWRNASYIAEPDRRQAREREIDRDVSAMYEYFAAVIAERARRPREDLISALATACEERDALTPLEVMSTVRLLLVAGNETTTNLIGNAALILLAHPEIRDEVRRNLSLVPKLVEETLRYDSPVQSLSREVAIDTEIAGVKIARGELVLPLIASANRDEAVFTAAHRFDLDREGPAHLTFGAGIHFCLGAPLARLQARVALEEVITRYDRIEHAGAAPLERIDSFFFRGLRALPLRVERRTRSR